jgi:hypothetical protein
MSAQTTVSDDRLAQIIDHEVVWFDWEVPIIAAELLARRAGDRQREEAMFREVDAQDVRQYHGPDVPPDEPT